MNVSSMVGLMGLPHNAIYALTKGAVRSFSEALRAELVATNIGLTTVFPGAHRTGITEGARGSQRAKLADMGRSRFASSECGHRPGSPAASWTRSRRTVLGSSPARTRTPSTYGHASPQAASAPSAT